MLLPPLRKERCGDNLISRDGGIMLASEKAHGREKLLCISPAAIIHLVVVQLRCRQLKCNTKERVLSIHLIAFGTLAYD